jgi:hypothetical protein
MEEVNSIAVRAAQVNDRFDQFYQACGRSFANEVFSGTLSDFLAIVESLLTTKP